MHHFLIAFCLIVMTFGVWLGSVPLSGGKVSYENDPMFWGFCVSRHQIIACAPGHSTIILMPGHWIRLGCLNIDTPY